jgi:hypothetical protein
MGCRLSAILVAGPCRARAQRVVDALSAQTAIRSIEIIVVDLVAESVPRLVAAEGATMVYVARPGLARWGQARAEAVRVARGPIVAFIEDHCFPAPDWAQHVIDAHRGPWAAVGYAFTNANPASHMSRSGLLARYGLFAHPVEGGPARFISGNNVSYKRDLLRELDGRMDTLLDIDFNMQEELKSRGHRLFIEARALAAHLNYTTLAGECTTGRPYCRLLASHRVQENHWGIARRVLYGIVTPLSAPAIRLGRLAVSLRGRPAHWRSAITGLPLIAVMYLSDALGESAGYLFGAGDAARAVLKYELETERDPG